MVKGGKIDYKGELVLSFIEHQIEDTDAKIDVEVFRLYGLNKEEVKTVMDALKVNRLYQDKVFEYFE